MYFWRDCPENYWCYRSLYRKHLFQALSHKNRAAHFVHEVLWDKGFRINTLVLGYQTWAVCGFGVFVLEDYNSTTSALSLHTLFLAVLLWEKSLGLT